MTRHFHRLKIIFAGLIVAAICCLPTEAESAVRIAVLDSGATAHVDRALSFTSYAGSEDPLNHGTHIAGLIREKNPGALIYMLQVCENEAGRLKPSKDAIVRAIDWAVKNDIDVVNMSLVTKYSQAVDRAITRAATEHGIIFVAAAGNKSLSSHFTANANGFITKRKKAVRPAFPASNPHVIAVGAVDHGGKVAKYSHELCDVYTNGEILGQEGSSFSAARITGKISRILGRRTVRNKELLISYLK